MTEENANEKIEKLIKTELQRNLNENMTQKKEKGKSSTHKSPAKERNGGGSDAAGLRLDAEAMAKIVGEVVSQLTPILVKTITTAISVCMTDSMSKEIKKIEKEQATQRQYVQQQTLNALYERDKLEQYDRRLNIRITGVEEQEHEAVEDLVEQVCAATEAPIKKEDISACHRMGERGNKHRTIICRFVSRDTQSRVMKNKKKLRGKEGYNNQVYINEDLTRLRARLFHLVRKSGKVTSTSTKNGRIYCNVPGKQRPIILDSPDDLHRLEFDEVPYSDLGLGCYTLPVNA